MMAYVLQYVCASCHVPIPREGGHCYHCGRTNPPAMRMDDQGRLLLTPFLGERYAPSPFPSDQDQIGHTQPSYNGMSERHRHADDFQRTLGNFSHSQPASMQQTLEIRYAPLHQVEKPAAALEPQGLDLDGGPASPPQRKPSGPSLRGRATLATFGRRPMDSGAARQARCEKAFAAANALMAKEKKVCPKPAPTQPQQASQDSQADSTSAGQSSIPDTW